MLKPGRLEKPGGMDFNLPTNLSLNPQRLVGIHPLTANLCNSQGLLYRLFSHASSLDLGLEASMDFGVGQNEQQN